MKATAILSALVFAHAAFAQATDSTSVAVSTSAAGSSSTAAAATTTAATTTVAQSSAPTTTSLSETKSRSKSKSNSAGTSTSEGATPSPTGASAPSGNQGSSGETPLIPTDISTGCSTFLKSLNADTQLSACFTPLLNAVSAYGPSSGSASGLSKALGNLCGSNACSQSTISAKLTQFKDSCANELTGDNPSQLVIQNYDVLYSVIPFKNAVCAKGDSQTYCLLDTSAGNNTSDSVTYATSHLANSVSRQGAQTVLVPNTDTYLHSNIMYLFSSPSMNAGELCTTCTQQVLAKYFAFQSAVPHALGLKKSLLLGGQNEFFAAIKEKCPSNFVVGISEIANVETPTDINRSGALPAYTGSILTAVAGALVAVVALV